MIDDSWFILKTCALISKQFFNVIKERAKIVIKFKETLGKERIELLRKCQFMNNIVNIDAVKIDYCIDITEKKVGSMDVFVHIKRDLTDFEGVKVICEMKQLTSLNITNNAIRAVGAKLISEMPRLIFLNISHNEIGVEGAKSISEMKQLTTLNINNNEIGDEGAKFISEMPQLRLLYICSNGVGNEGVNYFLNNLFLSHQFNSFFNWSLHN